MPVLTLLNQKGGVGKTSTCYHLAGAYSARGGRVLLVDNDPQASLTQGFVGPAAAKALDPLQTVAGVYTQDAIAGAVVRPSGLPGVDLVPGSRWAKAWNVPDVHATPWDVQLSLRWFLEDLRDAYDLVLIDCPPNLHLCSWAALAASDALVVPLQAEDFGAQGIADVSESVRLVRRGPNPELRHLGYLITMHTARTAVHRAYEAQLRGSYGDQVFATTVPYSVDFKEALLKRVPAQVHKPRGAAAKSLRDLADEIGSRWRSGTDQSVEAA